MSRGKPFRTRHCTSRLWGRNPSKLINTFLSLASTSRFPKIGVYRNDRHLVAVLDHLVSIKVVLVGVLELRVALVGVLTFEAIHLLMQLVVVGQYLKLAHILDTLNIW